MATLDPEAVRRVLDAIDTDGEALSADALMKLGLPEPFVAALVHTDPAAPGAPLVTVSSLDLLEAMAESYGLSPTQTLEGPRRTARDVAGRISAYLDQRVKGGGEVIQKPIGRHEL